MLVIVWLLLVVGVIYLIIGLRGRLVNRELHCKHCGYNLVGINRVPHTMCPECGHSVWVGVVVHSVRQMRPRMLRASMLIFALAMAAIGLILLERLAGLNLHQVRSTAALKDMVVATCAADGQEHAWRELFRRRNGGMLSDDDVGEIAAIAMDRHIAMLTTMANKRAADKTGRAAAVIPLELGSHHAAWLGLICNERLVDTERRSAYLETVLRPVVFVRTPTHAIEERQLPLTTSVRLAGLQGHESAEVVVMLESITVDNEPYEPQGWMPAIDTATLNSNSLNRSTLSENVPVQVKAGSHSWKFRVRVGVTHIHFGRGSDGLTAGRAVQTFDKWPATLWETTVRFMETVDVYPEPARRR